jgi:hypothetical protein
MPRRPNYRQLTYSSWSGDGHVPENVRLSLLFLARRDLVGIPPCLTGDLAGTVPNARYYCFLLAVVYQLIHAC